MKKTKKKPVAFLSYVRFDDQHEEGRITLLRQRLSAEVRAQAGEEFPIFQDRNDISWGENWKDRIEESIDSVTFLIPVLTPSFFKSPPCRKELEGFLEREKKLGRNDLILPLYYIDCPPLNDKAKRKKDKLAQVIASRQYGDWRELRFEPQTSPQVGKTLAQLAVQIRDALERSAPSPKATPESPGRPKRTQSKRAPTRRVYASQERAAAIAQPAQMASESAALAIASDSAALVKTHAAKKEPPTRVVDSLCRGDHTTIAEAIQAANPGDRIIVRPGVYQEGLVMDKPLEIIGEGELGEVVIQATGKDALLFQTGMGRVVNLVLKQMGGGEWFGVDITQGRLELEGCDISSLSLAGVAIHAGADPRLRRNRIHDGKAGGVLVYENGQGTLEDNDIFANVHSGVRIKTGGDPTIRRNRIHDGKAGGVFVYENGQGTLEDNDIFANALSGVEIKTGANPTLRRNRIHDGKQNGVFVLDSGQGTLEDNDIFANAFSGVEIKTGANPILRRNRIHDDKAGGVFVYENSQGTLEDNDIFGNAGAGVTIKTGGNPTLRRNRINKNGFLAIWLFEKGGGTFEENDLRGNAKGAWLISDDSMPNVKRAGNLE